LETKKSLTSHRRERMQVNKIPVPQERFLHEHSWQLLMQMS